MSRASYDETVRVWNAVTGELEQTAARPDLPTCASRSCCKVSSVPSGWTFIWRII